jgi:hypothetical protein
MNLKIYLLLAGIVLCATAITNGEDASKFVPVILEQEPSLGSITSISPPQIRIKFENSKQQIQKEKLLFEVDRTDVSAFVQFNDGVLMYQPPAALLAGQHEIRITGTSADGKPIQEILWNFTIQEAPKSFTFAIEPTGTFEYKARREDPKTDRQRFNSNIAIRNQSTGKFQTSFNSALQAQNPTPGTTPKDIDLANFQAVLAHGSSSVSFGDVLVNFDLLGVSNLSRRGIVFQQKLPFRFSGFDVFFWDSAMASASRILINGLMAAPFLLLLPANRKS